MLSRTPVLGRLLLLLALVTLLGGAPAEATGVRPPPRQAVRSASSGWSDLAVVGSGGGNVAPGRSLNLEIDFANDGNLPANGVTIQNTLPANTTYSSTYLVSCSECSAASSTPSSVSSSQVTYSLGSLAPQATGTIEFIVQIGPNATVGSSLTSLVQIADDPRSGPEQNLANNTSTITLNVIAASPPTVDLGLTGQVQGGFAPGGQGTIFMTLTNQGTMIAPNTQLTATLPTGVSYVSNTGVTYPSKGTPLPATVTGNQLVLNVGDVPSGATDGFILTLQVAPTVTVGTSLVTSMLASSDVADANPANDSVDVSVQVAQPYASLSLTPATNQVCLGPCNPTSVGAGTDATFPIQLQNTGSLDLPNLTITQTLPSFVTVGSAQVLGNPGSFQPIMPTVSGNQVSFPLGDLPANSSITLFPNYHLDPAAPIGSNLTITSNATASVQPSLWSNPLSSSFQVVAPSADLVASMRPLSSSSPTNYGFAPGGLVYYMLDVGSGGPTEALGVTMVDTLPAGATFVGTGESVCGYSTCNATVLSPVINGNQVTFNLGNLPQEGDWLDIAVRFDPSLAPGSTVTNTLQVSSATADPNPGNNVASAAATLQAPTFDLNPGVNCTPSCPVLSIVPGIGGYFPLRITNTGTVAAYNVEVTQTLPSGAWPLPYADVQTSDEQGPLPRAELAPLVTGSQAVYNLGTIPAGGEVDLMWTFQLDPSLAPGTVLTITTAVSSSPADDNPSNNSATITYQIISPSPTTTPTPSLTPTATPTLTPIPPTATPTLTPTATATASPTPSFHLYVPAVSYAPASTVPRGRLTVNLSVANAGPGTAPPSRANFYLAATNAPSPEIVPLFGGVSVGELSAKQSFTASTSVVVPASTAPGSYYVVACAEVTQARATRNCHAASTSLLVSSGPTATPSPTAAASLP